MATWAPSFCQPERDGAADALASAGDQDYFPVDGHDLLLSWCFTSGFLMSRVPAAWSFSTVALSGIEAC
jgi:hypothetical protein